MKRDRQIPDAHRPRPLSYLFCLLLSIALLLSLFACAEIGGTGGESTGGSETDPSEEPTESTAPQEAETADPSDGSEASGDDRNTLLYYVSLVEELQEEIRALKAENFILSSALSASTEAGTAPPESSDPSTPTVTPAPPYTYEIDDGEVTILSYTGSDREIVIPSEIDGHPVTEIGEAAFAGAALTSVVLPETLREIDWFAFRDCAALRTVTAGSLLSEIGYGAFDGCPASLTLLCPKDSYAERYARSFGIAVKNS